MKTIYETIWSVIGVGLILWFACVYVTNCQLAAVPPVPSSTHQKQTIEEFLNDHPDIKQRVDEIKRQAENDGRYKQS
jgi:hypothetical protein